MNTIDPRVERHLAIAAGLAQNGNMKTSIYLIDNSIFILNQDNTILIRLVPGVVFNTPLSFNADDYDSSSFGEEDGKIVFVKENKNYVRSKYCATPSSTPEEMQALYNSYPIYEDSPVLRLDATVQDQLKESLSHIEISVKDGGPVLIQKNIYNGETLKINKKKKPFNLSEDKLPFDFGPIGVRTGDFKAMFSFANAINISFPPLENKVDFLRITSNFGNFHAILATCIYDEIGRLDISRKE